MKLSLQKQIDYIIGRLTPALGIIAFVSLFLKYGFHLSDIWITNLLILDEIIAAFFVIILLLKFFINDSKWNYVKQSPFEFGLLSLFVISILFEEIISIEKPHILIRRTTAHSIIKLYFVIIQIYIVINGIIAFAKIKDKWLFYSLNPARILIYSFGFVILAGTITLKLPKATFEGIGWIDAFFTATSAVCITGLSTVNISKVFTFEGQVVIMFLIQLGGLGIITLTSFIALFIQQGFRLRDQIIVQEILDNENLSSLASILKAIVSITIFSEFLGAIGLYFSWGNLGLTESERIFNAMFHSISAYCNAGFSTFPNGFESAGYQFSSVSMVTIMALIVFGGLGFYTYSNIFHLGEINIIRKRGLTLQTKIILIGTLVLIVFGALMIWLTQYKDWKDLPLDEQVLQSFFLSITSRTAGFSVVPIGSLGIPTLMIVLGLMYIGGAPNSTSGGIKMTTVVTLIATLVAFVRGKTRVEIGWNTLPMRIVRRAFIVFMVSIFLIFTVMFVLTWTEDQAFFDIFFEIVSAFGTVGLSRGITPDLSLTGKLIIAAVMFAGRIGLFSFAIAMSEVKDDTSYKFPKVNLMVG